VHVHILPFSKRMGYVASAYALRRLLGKIKPDILNAHYATGYGLLARLSGFKPLLLSVWGSDVYDFPELSAFHRFMLKSNLQAATAIASTSRCMARKTEETFSHRNILITPFGVDEQLFTPRISAEGQNRIVIGTVKTLMNKYGIDTLIESFAIVKRCIGDNVPLFLEITGGGPDLDDLKALAIKLGIAEYVIFHGSMPHACVPEMLRRLDIYVALSRLDSESFGVAILEAGSCQLPVVVSDADGPAEVTLDGTTGFIVPRNNPAAAAKAIFRLVCEPELCRRMGQAGRDHVLANYTWEKSVDIMMAAYDETASLHGNTALQGQRQ
jgi:glycosyltransferase involved in cell wall biosynthesis